MTTSPEKYNEAGKGTDAVLTSLIACEDEFKERSLASPLMERNNDASQLTTIALDILRMLS